MKNARRVEDPCPCGSRRDYPDCCGLLHQGANANSAEQVMRARYSAYVMRLEDYLRCSWHPDTRPTRIYADDDVRPRWLGLRIKATDQRSPDEATVEFVARYRNGNRGAERLHETSRFQRLNERWYYRDGIIHAQ